MASDIPLTRCPTLLVLVEMAPATVELDADPKWEIAGSAIALQGRYLFPHHPSPLHHRPRPAKDKGSGCGYGRLRRGRNAAKISLALTASAVLSMACVD